jgi:hypothetical protein
MVAALLLIILVQDQEEGDSLRTNESGQAAANAPRSFQVHLPPRKGRHGCWKSPTRMVQLLAMSFVKPLTKILG